MKEPLDEAWYASALERTPLHPPVSDDRLARLTGLYSPGEAQGPCEYVDVIRALLAEVRKARGWTARQEGEAPAGPSSAHDLRTTEIHCATAAGIKAQIDALSDECSVQGNTWRVATPLEADWIPRRLSRRCAATDDAGHWACFDSVEQFEAIFDRLPALAALHDNDAHGGASKIVIRNPLDMEADQAGAEEER